MSCALCQSNSPLQKSHIIPEFFYVPLYDNIHRFNIVPLETSKSGRFKQKGLYEKLLCKACEKKFCVWETYIKNAFCEGVGIKINQSGDLLKLSNLDYDKFRLFLLSLLWRMGVSELDFFSLVSLGEKHEEILRLALLNADPLEPLQYPCLMSVVHNNDTVRLDQISQPTHMKTPDNIDCFCVMINGLLLRFYVTNQLLPSFYADACVSKKGEMCVLIDEVKSIPFLAEYFSEFGNAVRARSGGN